MSDFLNRNMMGQGLAGGLPQNVQGPTPTPNRSAGINTGAKGSNFMSRFRQKLPGMLSQFGQSQGFQMPQRRPMPSFASSFRRPMPQPSPMPQEQEVMGPSNFQPRVNRYNRGIEFGG
jgi:hypothetical protein